MERQKSENKELNLAFDFIFEKYYVALLDIIEPKDLRLFFKCEQSEKYSTNQCRQIIRSIVNGDDRLTRIDFYRLLERKDLFYLVNPLHDKPWHPEHKSLVKYFVATKTLPIKCSEKEIQDEKILLDKYDQLLNGVRCLELKLCWHKNNAWVMVQTTELIPGLPFDDLLERFRLHQKSKKSYPLILNLDCRRLKIEHMQEVRYLLVTVLEDILYQPDCPGTGKLLPSLKSLMGKVIVFAVKPAAGWNLSQAELFNPSQSSADERLIPDKKWLKLKELSSELDQQQIDDIQSSVTVRTSGLNRLRTEEESWPSVTYRLFTSVIHDDEQNIGGEQNGKIVQNGTKKSITTKPTVTDLMRWGIHTIPVEDRCGSALFQLNGRCGYVLKPAALRKGKLYCIGLSEDKPGLGEPSLGPTRFMLKILCTKNMNISEPSFVHIDILGHPKDQSHYQTKRGFISDTGNAIWSEQIRPALRLPNFIFIHFQIQNERGEILGQNLFPFKLLAKGIRFMELFDKNWKPLTNNERLYVHIDYRKIADCWSPDPNENLGIDEDTEQQDDQIDELSSLSLSE